MLIWGHVPGGIVRVPTEGARALGRERNKVRGVARGALSDGTGRMEGH